MRVAGRHPAGEWQVSQALLDWMWLEPLPVAFMPSWQLEQLPVIPVWLKPVAGLHAVVAWQLPHSAVVATCVADFPMAVVPLWQLEQAPMTCA